MPPYILAFMGSPRLGGNTDLLLSSVLDAASHYGARVEKIPLVKRNISPCLECGACDQTGQCPLQDDMVELYPALERADILILASPIFFYNITAFTQALIERAQALWVRKYVLKKPPSVSKKRFGIFLSLGATKGAKLFEGAVRIVRYFFDAVDVSYQGGLFFRGIEKKGDILKHPEALLQAQALGNSLAQGLPPALWPLCREKTP